MQVAVPGIMPDGGLTVVLLGASFLGLQVFGRKKVRA